MTSNRANIAADGEGVMQPTEHMDWFARALLLFNRSLLRQLPASYNIRLDPAQFLRSLTFSANNATHHPTPWDLAPDPAVCIPADPEESRPPTCDQGKYPNLSVTENHYH